jgi:hypothetical protein
MRLACSASITNTNTSTTETDTPQIAEKNHTNHEVLNRFLCACHRFEKMSFSTAWRWMRLLGLRYDTRRTSFYADGHEREDMW